MPLLSACYYYAWCLKSEVQISLLHNENLSDMNQISCVYITYRNCNCVFVVLITINYVL